MPRPAQRALRDGRTPGRRRRASSRAQGGRRAQRHHRPLQRGVRLLLAPLERCVRRRAGAAARDRRGPVAAGDSRCRPPLAARRPPAGCGWLGHWPARRLQRFSAHHREGDGTTPTGAFGFGRVVYGLASDPGFATPTTASSAATGGTKTRPRPPTTVPPRPLQRHAVVSRRERGPLDRDACQTTAPPSSSTTQARSSSAGASAIFLHRNVGGPTNGCVSPLGA